MLEAAKLQVKSNSNSGNTPLPSDPTFDAVAAHYGKVGQTAFKIVCPAHVSEGGDENCRVFRTPDGGAGVQCYSAGCAAADIYAGLRRDMGIDGNRRPAPLPVKDTVWLCRMADGTEATHVRYVKKDGGKGYAWRHTDAAGRVVNKLPPGTSSKDFLHVIGNKGPAPLAVVAEGEKAAEAVEAAFPAARVVATVQGAPNAPTAEVLAPALDGVATICLWPDNDVNGQEQMQRVHALLATAAPGAVVCLVNVDGMRPKGDAADLPGPSIVKRIEAAVLSPLSPRVASSESAESRAVTGLSPVSPVSPHLDIEPLPEIAPGAPFPIDALGEFAAAAEAVHEIVKTPLPICAASVLGSLSVCAQGASDVVLDGRIEPLSLYLLTVAPSGARKSACDAIIFRAIRNWDRVQGRVYYDEQQEYKRILARRKGKGPPPEPPADPKVLFTDATGEAVQRDARLGRYGTRGLVTDEGGRFFGGWSLTAERRLAGLSVYSALWDGGEITVRRMGEGASYTLHDRRVMLHIQVQAAVVKPFLTDPLVACQGLLGRFLVAQVDTVPAREYVRGNAAECPGVERLYATHELLLSKAIECKAIDQGGVRSTLTLDKAAIRYWAVVHDGFEKLRAGATDEALASFYGKAPAHTLRIAGVLAAAHGEGDIDTRRIQDASRIVQWYAADMERAQSYASVSSHDRDVMTFLHWLRRHQGKTITARMIQRTSTQAVKRGGVAKAREFMGRLVAAGYELSTTKDGWTVGDLSVTKGGDTGDKATNQ